MLDKVDIPFMLNRKSSLMYVQTPTTREVVDCELNEITAEEPLDPSKDDWEEKDTAVWEFNSSGGST